MWEAFLQIAGSFMGFAIMTLLADAIKGTIKSDDKFSFKIFYKTNILPALWSVGSGLTIAFLITFTPASRFFIESVTGSQIELDNMPALWGSAVLLGGFLKAKFGKDVTTAKLEIAKNKSN